MEFKSNRGSWKLPEPSKLTAEKVEATRIEMAERAGGKLIPRRPRPLSPPDPEAWGS